MKLIIKSYLRNIRNRKSIHIITIGGFAVSLAVCILVYSFIVHEKSYDSRLPEIEDMYRITREGDNGRIPMRSREKILERAPEIKQLCLFHRNQLLFRYNEIKNNAIFLKSDELFFSTFSVRFLKGDQEEALQAKNNIVVTESFAKKYFENSNPLGESIELIDGAVKTVVAMIADPAENSSVKYDVIMNLDNGYFNSSYCSNEDCYIMYDNALLLYKNADQDSVQKKISTALQGYTPFKSSELGIQKFKEVYFNNEIRDGYDHANVKFIEMLSAVALIILILAIINYVNLSVAANLERFKEVCVRKTNGARVRSIISQFLTESYISCFIAAVLAIVFLFFFSSFLNTMLNIDFNVTGVLKQPLLVFSLLGLVVFLGTIVGFVPAKIASFYNPVELMQRKSKTQNSTMANIFNTVQFVVALCLIIGLVVINKQLEYAKTKDMGFEKDHLLRVQLQGVLSSKSSTIKDKLLTNSSIINVAATRGNPLNVWSIGSGSFKVNGEEVEVKGVYQLPVDESFNETFKVKLLKGRDFRFTDKNVCIINEKFYKSLEWDDLENKNIWGATLIGVISDIHFEDLHKPIGNLQLQYNIEERDLSILNIRIKNSDIPTTLSYIKSVIKEFDNEISLDYTFYDETINTLYHKEEEQASAIKLFALIAIFLTCLGLYGKIELAGKSRIKEIGIRKVNGAKVVGLMALLNKDFVQLVAIAFIVAAPLSKYVMKKWLDTFAYKTELSWWIFALAGLITLGIAIVTVSWQSWQAARKNPVEALRYE